ncbi:MAG: hypothetical protein R2781_07705 [Flavobacteriaceae bacterium]
MIRLLPIFLLIFTLVSCKNELYIKSKLNIETAELIKETAEINIQQNNSLVEQWNLMVFEKGGCLGSGQFFKEPKVEIPSMVFSENEWNKFAENDKQKLTEFLINKLSDTTKTNVHTCPFFAATEGEMAVYSLQHIHKKNWFDFSEFSEYKNREYKSAVEQPQMWLWNILKDEANRKLLADLYLNELEK